MSIDLSKAKIGDKFRTRNGNIMVYVSAEGCELGNYTFRCIDDIIRMYYNQEGRGYMSEDWELVEQVFDEPEPKVTFEETEPKPSFAFPKMDEFDKTSKELMQTLKNQLGNINNEQRFARRERIALALIHIMGADRLDDLVENTTVQDNLKDLVDIVESVIGR